MPSSGPVGQAIMVGLANLLTVLLSHLDLSTERLRNLSHNTEAPELGFDPKDLAARPLTHSLCQNQAYTHWI